MNKGKLSNFKDKICSQFYRQMKVDYPSITLESINASFDNWIRDREPKGIIEMFLFPELDKLAKQLK